MSLTRPELTEYRDDISRFMVHLSRDSRYDRGIVNGGTAENNLGRILEGKNIIALKAHCLHAQHLPPQHLDKFQVTCFTETPLSQLGQLAQEIQGRSINLEPYGIAFKRTFIVGRGAQPVTYINSYGSDKTVRKAYDDLYEAAAGYDFDCDWWKMLPFVSAMHANYDFSWEREWRIQGSVRFTFDDIAFVILPDGCGQSIRSLLAQQGVLAISLWWPPERIAEESAKQLRASKKGPIQAPKSPAFLRKIVSR